MFNKKKKKQAKPVAKAKLVELYRQAVRSEIPLEVVDRKVNAYFTKMSSVEYVQEEVDHEQLLQSTKLPFSKRLFFTLTPLICLILGVTLVGSAAVPIASYYLFTVPAFSQNNLNEVVPKIIVQAKEAPPLASNDLEQPTIINRELDYTNLSNWFPTLSIPEVDESKSPEYIIDIPSLDIQNARVKLGGSNLDKSLIQYPGTAMPGQVGEPVIFGHSILRQFYNPSEKNPRRYISIFSKIMTLSKGDKIYITFDNVKYTYVVKQKRVVKPEDTSILEQVYNSRGLRLITCTPEGTTLERGIVDAEIVANNE